MKKLTKTFLKKNIKVGPNPYGCGFRLLKDGEMVVDYRGYGLKKSELVEKIYKLQDEVDFDEITLHSPSSDGYSDSGNKIKIT